MELQNQIFQDNKHGVKELKDSLTSNSFKPSPYSKAEAEKKKAQEGKGDGKKRKGKGNGKENGSTNQPGEKKSKKSVAQCSLCGPEAGHTDLFCWKSHTTDKAKEAIEANKKKPEMAKHFKNLEHAASKRAKAET